MRVIVDITQFVGGCGMNQSVEVKVHNQDRFMKAQLDASYYEAALKRVIQKVELNLDMFTDKFPSSHTINGIYEPVNNADLKYYSDWTSSFWTGMIWLAHELTGEHKYANVGQKHIESFKERFIAREILNHHDIGFLYILSCVAPYKLMSDSSAKEVALDAAKLLAMRFREHAGIIQVRGYLDDLTHKETGVYIVDCSMNVPLLFWASEVTNDSTYYNKAKRHMENVAKYMVRDNGAVYQMYRLDIHTGEPLGGWTGQGFADEACWSRGQAWALYGLALAYRYTKETHFIDSAKKVANYFLNNLPSDLVCNWDHIFLEDDGQRDTSAAAIAVCGLLELVSHLPVLDSDRALYHQAALAILTSLSDHYELNNDAIGSGVLDGGVYSLPINSGVNECMIWGDYFYMEALVRATRTWASYW